MNKLLLGLVSITISTLSIAQPYGNEWIDYSADRYYFKFQVAEDGIYRIDQLTLTNALVKANAPVALSSIDPRTIQVFAKGQEQYIHVEGQGDGSFDASDYIELYCERNTGWLDERMYPSATQQTNPNYSLYTDTLTYFVTWDASGAQSTFRYTTVPYGTAASTPMDYFLKQALLNYKDVYHAGANLQSGKPITRYGDGKGWICPNFGYNTTGTEGSKTAAFSSVNAFNSAGAPDAKIEMGLIGYNLGAGGDEAHHVRVQQSATTSGYATLDDVVLKAYEYRQHVSSFPVSELSAGSHNLRAYVARSGSLVDAATDYCALSYMKFTYPHSMSFAGESIPQTKIRAPQNTLNVHFSASSWSAGATSFLYDPQLGRRYVLEQSGTTIR